MMPKNDINLRGIKNIKEVSELPLGEESQGEHIVCLIGNVNIALYNEDCRPIQELFGQSSTADVLSFDISLTMSSQEFYNFIARKVLSL